MVNSYCMVTRYSELLQSLYFPAKRRMQFKFFLLNFSPRQIPIYLPILFIIPLPKFFDSISNFDSILKQMDCFSNRRSICHILPPVVLFSPPPPGIVCGSKTARDLEEREKIFVCYCLFYCLQKFVMSGLLVCFVRSDLIWSFLVLVSLCDPAPKIDISIFGPEIETNLAVFLNIAKIFDSIFNVKFTIEIGSRQTLVLMIPSN